MWVCSCDVKFDLELTCSVRIVFFLLWNIYFTGIKKVFRYVIVHHRVCLRN